ncbi:MAG: hypothetical protein HQ582_05585 [Planctomycetes bacterium]|nr:hypothetical protein [Planctomycetota bacterium]
MKTPRTMLVLLLSTVAAGCHTTRDALDDFSISLRNRSIACQAWHESGWKRANPPHVKHFEDGFMAGYVDVASGKSGCLPPLPPRKYWSPSSLNSAGRQTSFAWYNGYAQGALSAENDGVGGWSRLGGIQPAAHQQWSDPDALGGVLGEARADTVRPLPVVEDDFQHVPFSPEPWHPSPAAGPARN